MDSAVKAEIVNFLDTMAGECRTLARIYEDMAESVAAEQDPSLLDLLADAQIAFAR